MAETRDWRSFYDELKRRRVIRTGTIYVVLAWPIIQIVDILSPALALSDVTIRYVLIAFAIGLPVSLALSWLFDFRRGHVVKAGAETTEGPTGSTGFAIAISFFIVIGVLLYFQAQDEPVAMAPVASERSIAVLPFVPFSKEAEDEYFADGLTEELLNVLSKIEGLDVIARTTSFAYKGVSKPVDVIGQELEVGTILEGSVRRSDTDNRIRITAQLIDVESGTHLWSQNFDREFRGVLEIQDDIARAVADELELRLVAGADSSNARPERAVALARGHSELAYRTRDGVMNAIAFFRDAVEQDPSYLLSHTALAKAYVLGIDYADLARDEMIGRAERSLALAEAIDPDAADVHATRGLIDMFQAEIPAARASFEQALARNPSDAMATMWYATVNADPAVRRQYYQRAFELDPKSPVTGFNYANELMAAGQEADAMLIFGRIIEADPLYPAAYTLVGDLNRFRGRLDESLIHYERAYSLDPNPVTALQIASLNIDLGEHDVARDWLEIAGQARNVAGDFEWVEIGSLVARGDPAAAQDRLEAIREETPDGTALGFARQHLAAYYLEDYETTVSAYESLRALDTGLQLSRGPGVPTADIAAAHAYQQLGDGARAAALLDAAEATLVDAIAVQPRVHPGVWFALAQVMTLKGNADAALGHLQRAVDEGFSVHWLVSVEPIFAPLYDRLEFKTILARLEASLAMMRDRMRLDAGFDDWE